MSWRVIRTIEAGTPESLSWFRWTEMVWEEEKEES